MKHPFRIYTQDNDGKHLIGEGCARTVELAREQCVNIVTEDKECPDVTQKSTFGDSANKVAPLPDDSTLLSTYLERRKIRNCLDSVLAGCGIEIF